MDPVVYLLSVPGLVLTVGGLSFLYVRIAKLIRLEMELDARKAMVSRQNNKKMAIEFIKEDVNRIERSMVAFSDSADDWLWAPVANDLKDRALRGVPLCIVVSKPNFNEDPSKNSTVRNLAKEGYIRLFSTPARPSIDLRVIDNCHVHASYHGLVDDDQITRHCLRSSPDGASQKDLQAVRAFIRSYSKTLTPLPAESL